MNLEQLNGTCTSLLDSMPEALGLGVVDLGSGLPLALAQRVPDLTQNQLNALAAAGTEYFRGRNIAALERVLSGTKNPQRYIEHVHVATKSALFFLTVVPAKPDIFIALGTAPTVNVGMGSAWLRAAVSQLAPHCP